MRQALYLLFASLFSLSASAANMASYPADVVESLQRLKDHPRLNEEIGNSGRILEIVGYDAGVMIRYQLESGQQCIGRFYSDPVAKRDIFTGDQRCPSPNGRALDFLQMPAGTPNLSMAINDIQMIASAARFAKRLAIRPSVERVLGVYQNHDRVVVTYRNSSEERLCTVSIRPSGFNNQLWSIVAPATCQDR